MHSVFLNGNFSVILSGWKSFYNTNGVTTSTVSLTIESTLSVDINGNLSVYTYYNNLPFNPLSMKYVTFYDTTNSTLVDWFNGTGINTVAYSAVSYVPVTFNITPSISLNHPDFTTYRNSQSQRVAPTG